MGNKMSFSNLEDAMSYYNEHELRDPHDPEDSADIHETHWGEPIILLSPRPDNYVPVICEPHRLVQCLLDPSQRAAAVSFAERTALAIAK